MSSHEQLIDGFRQLAVLQDSEFQMAAQVAQFIDPELLSENLFASLDEVLVQLNAGGQIDVQTLLDGLLGLGFGLNPLQQADISHSHIGWVIEQRQGLPITMAVLLIECARRSGLHACGINFPGHFLVQVEADYVDPLSMQVISEDQLNTARLSAADLQSLLQPASAQALGLRMLNNVKNLYGAQQDWQRLLDLLDCQLALTAGQPEMSGMLHFERAEVWERLGVVRMARDAYQQCLDSDVSRDLSNKALARLAGLDGRDETLH